MDYKLYKILNVDKNANLSEIKKSYKKLAFKYHPDRNIDNKEEAEKKFQEISNAYDVLSDPDKRRHYNLLGDNSENFGMNNVGANPFEMFNSIFKNHVQSFMNQSSQNTDINNLINKLKTNTQKIYKGYKEYKNFNNNLNNSFNFSEIVKDNVKKKKRRIKGKPQKIIIDLECTIEEIYNSKLKNIQYERKINKDNKIQDELMEYNVPLVGNELLMEKCGHILDNYSKKGDVIIKICVKHNDNFIRMNKYDLIIYHKISLYDFYHNKELKITLPNSKTEIFKFNYIDIMNNNYILNIKNKGFPYLNSKKRGNLIINITLDLPIKYDLLKDILKE